MLSPSKSQRLPFFDKNRKSNPKIHMVPKKSQNSQRNVKNKAGSIKAADFKLHYKALVLKQCGIKKKKTYRPREQNRAQR